MRDFLRETAFLDKIPLLPAVSSSFTRAFNLSEASAESLACTASMNFLALVRAELFAALLRMRRSSLCLCLFSADVCLTAKGDPPNLNCRICYQTEID